MSRIRVLSYNVRYDNRHDGHDVWHDRRDGVIGLVRFHRPDVAAFQEPLTGQREDLRDRLSEYIVVGRGRDPDGEGEGCPIGVRSDRWRVVDDGTFWLSETPTEPSTGWDAARPRIATWVRVRPRASPEGPVVPAGGSFLVVNTHFDHAGVRARRESARILAERLPKLAAGTGNGGGDEEGEDGGDNEDGGNGRLPVVFVGDLNCTAGSEPHRILVEDGPTRDGEHSLTTADLRDAAAAADVRHGPSTSITDFDRLIDGRRIDHVLVSPDVGVEAFATLADRDDRGRYPSDHLPVLARLRL